MKKHIGLLITLAFAIILSCQKTDLLNPEDQISHIDFQISGLNSPGDSTWYECWVMWTEGEGPNQKNKYESLGFLANNNSSVYSKSLDLNLGFVQKMLHLVVSIEQDTVAGYQVTTSPTIIDSVKGPSSYKIIAAKIAANNGLFDIGNELILDFDFENAQAQYILDTPTDTFNTNLKQGIWFVNLDTVFNEILDSLGTLIGIDTTIKMESGLGLPKLPELLEIPEDWFYEGWTVFGNDTISMGKFKKPAGADDTLTYGAGLASGYKFPGEDFINNSPPGIIFPNDLSGIEVFVSINPPYPENSNKPFWLIPFKTVIPVNCESKKVYSMENNIESFPTGNVSISISVYD